MEPDTPPVGDTDPVQNESDNTPGPLIIRSDLPDVLDPTALALPTIFPHRVATLITTLASSTRLTLSVVAFFIETILETSQFSTRLSLGYTRRLLISAITSARRVYLLSNAALSGDMLTLLDSGIDSETPRTDAFFSVLDRYTNLGIYVIHHTFTLAELFTMSGFYLAGSAVSSAHAAARESVMVLDAIFGSNESSRALASIIGLVKKELLVDERWIEKGRERGTVRTLAGLTKAMTAFAVLQNATWKRTSGRLRMKVIYDCTVHSSRQVSSTRSTAKAQIRTNLATVDEGGFEQQAIAGPGPSTTASRQAREAPPLPTASTITATSLSASESATHTPHTNRHRVDPDLDRLADELEELVGRDDIMELSDELTESTVITQLLATAREGQRLSEEEEWVEVDDMLDGEIPSITNESTRIRPISAGDRSDHPRLQLVLKTITKRIMKRRRTFRRHGPDDGLPMEAVDAVSPPTPHSTPYTSPQSVPTDSPKSSPSKRSSPFKALSQAKAAVARRLHLSSPPKPDPDPVELSGPPSSERSESMDRSSHSVDIADTSGDTASFGVAPSIIESSKSEQPLEETPGSLFPHDGLVVNIHRFMRYSSAAYGQHFLRILGLGNSDYNFPSTAQHHFNSWAFVEHTNLAIDALLLTSHTDSGPSSRPGTSSDKALPLVHYVSVDHRLKAVVLTCRGTLGLSDVLIDLTCDYTDIELDGADPDGRYFAHKGMYQSAINLTSRHSTVHQGLVDALTRYTDYGLVICGHSLGGGVAAMFAILSSMPSSTFLAQDTSSDHLKSHPEITTSFVTSFASGLPPGRPIHAYAYGPPALASPDLAKYARGLITSVVLNNDVVPCLSLGVLRDLKNIALTLYEEDKVAEEIVGRVAGLYKRRFAFQQASGPEVDPPVETVLSDWMMSLVNTMRADMDNDKLYPPGSVYIMEYHEIFSTGMESIVSAEGDKSTTRQRAHRAILRLCESVEQRFREPLFTKTMLQDHLPSGYERATQLLYDGVVDP